LHVLDVHCSEPIVGNGDIENRQLEYLTFVAHWRLLICVP